MKLKLEMNLDNSAFEDAGETSRILREAAEMLEFWKPTDSPIINHPLRDANGNIVGSIKTTRSP